MSIAVTCVSGFETESLFCHHISYYGYWITPIPLQNGEVWGANIGIPATKAWLPKPGPNSQYMSSAGIWVDESSFPVQTGKKSTTYVNCDSLSQYSHQSPIYSDLDSTPMLSTGLTERPVHHIKVDGTVTFPSLQAGPRHKVFSSSGSTYSGYLSGYKVRASVEGTFLDSILIDGIVSVDLGYPTGSWFKHIDYFVVIGQGLTRIVEDGKPDHYGALTGFRGNRGSNKVSPVTTTGRFPGQDFSWYPLEGVTSEPPSDQDLSAVVAMGNALCRRYNDPNIGLAAYSKSAYSNLDLRGGYDVNMVENLTSLDLKNLAKLPKKLKSLGHNIRTVKDFVHQASSLYLGKKYGYDNTVRDFASVCEYIHKNGLSIMKYTKSVLYGSDSIPQSDGSLELHTKMCLIPRPGANSSKVERLSNTLGLELSPSQFWACVPFSFAVDWFVRVGSSLEQLDAHALVKTRYTLDYAVYSYKRIHNVQREDIVSLQPAGSTISNLTVSIYDRCISTVLPPAPLDLEVGGGLKDHFIEAGALVLNRLSN